MPDPLPDVWVLCRNRPGIQEDEVDSWLLRRLESLESAGVCARANLWRVQRLEDRPAGRHGWLLELRGRSGADGGLNGLLEELRLLGLDPAVLGQEAGDGGSAPRLVHAA